MPKHLKAWKRPDSYMGAEWPDHFVFLGQHRDSDAVTRSNFTVGLEELGGESETVLVVRESHWAVGWVEWIAIHKDDAEALDKADAMRERIDNYPLLDEGHYSDLQWSEATDYWARMSVRERVELCQRFGLCVFSARRGWIPQDDSGSLFEYLSA